MLLLFEAREKVVLVVLKKKICGRRCHKSSNTRNIRRMSS